MGTKIAETIVFDIIDELTDRSGFDGWWHGCDTDTRQEIQGALVGIIDDNMERVKSLSNSEEN